MTNIVAKTIQVLLVDDDEADYQIIRDLIAENSDSSFRLSWEPSITQAESTIQLGAHDIYLINSHADSQNGLKLLAKFNLVERPEPFIILTEASDEQVEKKAMKMGVADYLVKGTLDAELLSRVLHYSLQRKLFETQRIEQLKEISRSKDEFIALASHQLRTPATAVKQYVGMILEGFAGEITDEQRKLLNDAYASNERQIQVVNDILRVAKLDLKKIVLKQLPTDLLSLMESLLHDLDSQFAERDQSVTFVNSAFPIYASIDSDYIRMALSNIVDNASKYSPQGRGITITIDKRACNTVAISITDHGVGIGKDDLAKLFKKFSRIDNILSVKVGGTGLGLYWSKEIIEIHGGEIEVTSVLGKGTTFTILLPSIQVSLALRKIPVKQLA